QRRDFVLGGKLRVHYQYVWHRRHQRNGSEVGKRVVWKRLEQPGIDGKRCHRSHDQRIAVGFCTTYVGDTDIASGTGTVLDDYGLAQWLTHLFGQESSHYIERPARRIRHDEPQGFGGPIGHLRTTLG